MCCATTSNLKHSIGILFSPNLIVTRLLFITDLQHLILYPEARDLSRPPHVVHGKILDPKDYLDLPAMVESPRSTAVSTEQPSRPAEHTQYGGTMFHAGEVNDWCKYYAISPQGNPYNLNAPDLTNFANQVNQVIKVSLPNCPWKAIPTHPTLFRQPLASMARKKLLSNRPRRLASLLSRSTFLIACPMPDRFVPVWP